MGRPATPWTDPKVGDVCSNGRKTRTVLQVSYRGSGSWQSHSERRLNDWVDAVVYACGNGEHTCSASRWAAWCRQAVRTGGRYLRDGEDAVQRAAEDALFSGEDHT